ncbi:hypothetical protein GCM10009802_06020 [Streptomyces synnematoformans]|uniref:Transposase n=1 Tax=Streptomyces synnematoformans TaxID=415721 RepID=A0ABN2XG76_9ACTN
MVVIDDTPSLGYAHRAEETIREDLTRSAGWVNLLPQFEREQSSRQSGTALDQQPVEADQQILDRRMPRVRNGEGGALFVA